MYRFQRHEGSCVRDAVAAAQPIDARPTAQRKSAEMLVFSDAPLTAPRPTRVVPAATASPEAARGVSERAHPGAARGLPSGQSDLVGTAILTWTDPEQIGTAMPRDRPGTAGSVHGHRRVHEHPAGWATERRIS
jgi:hypothetical protein